MIQKKGIFLRIKKTFAKNANDKYDKYEVAITLLRIMYIGTH